MATHVAALSESQMQDLEARLAEGDFERKEVPHARLALKGEGVSCTLYRSGKCVVQGKGLDQFLERYLPGEGEARIAQELDPERAVLAVGSDEAGKGDYFGPLVVAAVAYGPEYHAAFEDVRLGDSKKITAPVVRRGAKMIRDLLPHATVVLRPERYNQLYAEIGNLNRLLAWAHGAAIEKVLEQCDASLVIVDKFCEEPVLRRAFKPRARAARLSLRPRAESHPAVGAASMLASDVFWRELERLGREFDLTLPKGAGDPVDAAARRLVKARGEGVLAKVAKLHFKTTQKVLGS
ncbi:MAG: ribonuclease HIII [Planctomycetota bacterium]